MDGNAYEMHTLVQRYIFLQLLFSDLLLAIEGLIHSFLSSRIDILIPKFSGFYEAKLILPKILRAAKAARTDGGKLLP